MKPVDPHKMRHMEAKAREIGEVLKIALRGFPDTGFTLMLYSYDGSEFTYISSSRREDMVKVMMEFIAENPPAMTWDEQHG